jgi:hypothetical protein
MGRLAERILTERKIAVNRGNGRSGLILALTESHQGVYNESRCLVTHYTEESREVFKRYGSNE